MSSPQPAHLIINNGLLDYSLCSDTKLLLIFNRRLQFSLTTPTFSECEQTETTTNYLNH